MSTGDMSDETRRAAELSLWTGQSTDPEARRQVFLRTGVHLGDPPAEGITAGEWGAMFALVAALGLLALLAGPTTSALKGYLAGGRPPSPGYQAAFAFAVWGTTWPLARRCSPFLAFVACGTGVTLGLLLAAASGTALALFFIELSALVGWARAAKRDSRGGRGVAVAEALLFFVAFFVLVTCESDPRAETLRGALIELGESAWVRFGPGYAAACREVAAPLGVAGGQVIWGLPGLIALGYWPSMWSRDWLAARLRR